MFVFLVGASLSLLAAGAAGLYALALAFRPCAEKLSLAGLNKKVLVVTAHPGNYEQLGSVRTRELVNSCADLGIPEDRVKIVDDSDLPDDPKKHWATEKIATIVGDYVKQSGIDTIITFDEGGISGHLNHIALYRGVETLLLKQEKSSFPSYSPPLTAYTLKTVPLLRKYISVLDLAFCASAAELLRLPAQHTIPRLSRTKATPRPEVLLFVSKPAGYTRAVDAMKKHKTQWVWFRMLYVMFSRYMVFNELRMLGT
ncbi:MAG: putative deacetylase LmbE-like domain-containing protein [Olpidium bornovanus]|uniref:N-acetylglucosaminylphosphatidylinositol deacetylase n=1 Tax=Olpidium bornovanus TaxID=278681 RepID=A0A8H8DL72_9FUNG|nr:MAG: putative deacetylase LmbE-like domain-containing protein [Olpidium bornovanus]